MKLVRLEIQALPGVEPGFRLERLDPAVNVVTGPNGIGKSSLIRALRYLVAGVQPGDPHALSLAATLANGAVWSVRRAGGQVTWQRDGEPGEAPSLPGPDELHCYFLSMEDLLAADGRDEVLVAGLRRALAGGYDLKALADDAELKWPARPGQSEARRLQQARQALREVDAEYQALRDDEGELPRLDAALTAARAAAERAERLARALNLLEAVQRLGELDAELAGYPESMARLRGDELTRLDALDDKHAKLSDELARALMRRATAAAALSASGLATRRPTGAELEAQRTRLAGARHRQELRAEKLAELTAATAAEAHALADLGGMRGRLPRLQPSAIAAAERLAADLKAKETAAADLEARIDDVGPAPPDAEVDRLVRAVQALRTWVAAHDGLGWPTSVGLWLAAAAAVTALGIAHELQDWRVFGAGAVGLVGLLAAAFMLARRRRAAVQRYRETGLEAPERWRRDLLNDRLEAIEAELASQRQAQVRAHQAAAERRRLVHLRDELAALEGARRELADELGFDPALTAVAVDRFVRLVDAYQRARAERESRSNQIDRLQQEQNELISAVHGYVADWQPAPDRSLEALEAAVADLAERLDRATTAARDQAEADRDVHRLEQQLSEADEERARLFSAVGLSPNDRTALQDQVPQLAGWRHLVKQAERAQMLEEQQRGELQGEPELLDRVRRNEREALARDRAEALAAAASLEDLQERRTQIRTRLDDAGAGQKLAAALADCAAARDALRQRADDTLAAAAGRFLLDQVESEYRSEHEPEVLRDARERFRRFTHQTWDLQLDDTGFRARDARQGRWCTLAELSSGTRMQLLLAVRLAWTRRVERGSSPLPLFLDEALTTADEERFAAVAGSLNALAQDEGRQVFYLSARRQELALWERATGVRPHHIDLAAARFGSGATADQLRLPERTPLPPPGGRDAAQYGADLGVPFVDPRRPAGEVPLFHLLRDDLPLLHRLMEQWRITSLGQLQNLLLASAADAALGDRATRDRLAGRCTAAEAWLTAWRQGRGRPVDRIAVESSGAVTDRFLTQVAEAAEAARGDGAVLLGALRAGHVPRFRAGSIDDLEQWLHDEGYLDPRPLLSREERARVTLQSAGHAAAADDIHRVVEWLEAGARPAGPTAN